MYTPSPYYQFSSSTPASMAYAMPSHGFSAMLTSSSPSPPMLFGPPPIRIMPRVASPSENAFKSPITGKLLFEESMQVNSAKPRKNARSQNQSAKEGTGDGDGPAPKRAKTSKAKAKVKEEDDDDADKVMWKDFWVEHLIHIRGGMNDEFNKMPKQGIDLWGKVATKLASMFANCDKDGQACRKKWARVNKQHREDKAHNAISGNDRKRSCKWYDVVDEYMHDRANVVCKSHASSIGEELEPGDHGQEGVYVYTKEKEEKKVNPKSNAKDDALHQLVMHMKEESSRRAAMEERRQKSFEAMQSIMASLLQQAQKD
ncbi:hypothetical protein GOP47_0027979 [Adiantum capillus-veneris]|nr:hypothetical protein GOP47_0027979 [Adiantum capillus-veneris]